MREGRLPHPDENQLRRPSAPDTWFRRQTTAISALAQAAQNAVTLAKRKGPFASGVNPGEAPLLRTWCSSSRHVGNGGIRLEPTTSASPNTAGNVSRVPMTPTQNACDVTINVRPSPGTGRQPSP